MSDIAIWGPIAREDLPGLCERICGELRCAGPVVRCSVAGIEADAVAVDALARLQLAALQLGGCICLRDAPDELYELLSLAGLRTVLRAEDELIGCARQPEEREELVDVEEEADP